MIVVKDLVKTFDGFKALDGISLTVPTGSVYGLVGPNGAGKSTLLRSILGIYKEDGGSITIDNIPAWENEDVKARLASIPDDWFFFLNSTIKEMKNFYKGVYPNFNEERYEKLKEAFPIDEKKQIRHLSKGMQKQVAFWLALSTMPDYLILDEPVDGLDPVMRRQVWSLMMNDVAERGTTVLVSSHNLRELEDVCDHVGIMNKGKLLLERDLSSLQDNIIKLQVAFEEGVTELPEALNKELSILHLSKHGRVFTIIVHHSAKEAEEILKPYNPILVDAIPLTMEEIFVYELGGENYEVKEIIL